MRRDALHQAIAAVAIAAIVVAGALYLRQRPQGPDSLKAEISVLRSQAAETELVLGAAPQLYERFLRAHARQLAGNIDREQDSIAKLDVEPRLRDAQRFASNAAQRLAVIVRTAGAGDARAQSGAARVIAGELEVLEHALQR